MSLTDVLQRVVDAEQRGKLWEQRVLGFPVWALERDRRYREELSKEVPDYVPVHRRGALQLASTIAKPVALSARDLMSGFPPSRRGRDIWVLAPTGFRRKDPGGTFRSIYVEHLRRQMGDRLLFIEHNAAGLPRLEEDVVYVDAIIAAFMAAGTAVAPAMLARPALRRRLAAFEPSSPASLCRDAFYGRAMQRLAHRWLSAARPEAVFVLCGYTFFIPFQIAARRLGIPVIELQHGIIGEDHSGYMLAGAPEMPHFPDHIVVFGRHFGNLLEDRGGVWRGRWSVGGHPWLSACRARMDASASRQGVAVFSNGDLPTARLLSGIIEGLKRMLPDVDILIKPHPLELAAERHYASVLGDNVRLVGHLDDGYELLSRARLCLAVRSTVSVDALALGCRSVQIHVPSWGDHLREFIDRGYIHSARSAGEVATLYRQEAAAALDGVAADLFGVDEPEPDFEELISRVKAHPRPLRDDRG